MMNADISHSLIIRKRNSQHDGLHYDSGRADGNLIVKTVRMNDRIQNNVFKNEISKATLAIAPTMM